MENKQYGQVVSMENMGGRGLDIQMGRSNLSMLLGRYTCVRPMIYTFLHMTETGAH